MLARTTPALFFRSTLAQRMTICVGVKRVVDYTVKVRVKDGKVATDGVKMSPNPFDEIALEEAIRLKDKKVATEVVAISIGPKKGEETLRTALAMGADKAIHIVTGDSDVVEPLAVAKIFAKLHAELKPGMWLLGKQAIDGDFGVTPQLLAALIDAPQGTFASAIEVKDGKVKVTREIDAGQQVVELALPAVLAADLRLNTPRLATLPNIMKARKKPIDTRDANKDFNGAELFKPRLVVTKAEEPPVRKAGIIVKDVQELYTKLRDEAKAI